MKIIRVSFAAPALLALGVWLALGQPKGDTVTARGEVVDRWCYLEGGDTELTTKSARSHAPRPGIPSGLSPRKATST